jgi:2-polyprenyl-3-methyl-5-hydroxy-6-metoxy-1,4-benzoquinol methylase
MFKNDTDREWEAFGKRDPYYGVLTEEKYRTSNLSEENQKEFFDSGRDYVAGVLDKIKVHIDSSFTIKRALDFGCGVGRLVIPLSEIADDVTGVDISESMLDEARKNCEARSIRNAEFVKSDDTLSRVKGTYNFIHSYIVFMHIPVARGDVIFQHLLDHLEEGGVGAVHFTFACDSKIKRAVSFVKNHVPLAKNIANVLKGKNFFAPRVQMNTYDLHHLFLAMRKAGAAECYTEFTNHSDYFGVVLYFRKQKTSR